MNTKEAIKKLRKRPRKCQGCGKVFYPGEATSEFKCKRCSSQVIERWVKLGDILET